MWTSYLLPQRPQIERLKAVAVASLCCLGQCLWSFSLGRWVASPSSGVPDIFHAVHLNGEYFSITVLPSKPRAYSQLTKQWPTKLS